MKFRTDDIVVALLSSPCGAFMKGCHYKIRSYKGPTMVMIYEDEHGSKFNGWIEQMFQLVSRKSPTHLPEFL